jgi:hypothetical protein
VLYIFDLLAEILTIQAVPKTKFQWVLPMVEQDTAI